MLKTVAKMFNSKINNQYRELDRIKKRNQAKVL